MKITPILYKGNMIRALLDGRKTHTRRIMTPAQVEVIEWVAGGSEGEPADTDRLGLLWGESTEELPGGKVKTHPAQWLVYSSEYPEEGVIPIGKGYGRPGDLLWCRETFTVDWLDELHMLQPPIIYRADYIDGKMPSGDYGNYGKWRPSIHMPRWASRLTLRITDVRVERVQDISEADAIAEGIDWDDGNGRLHSTARLAFSNLWDSIYAAPSPVKENGLITHYVSFPWEDIQETREHKGLPWYVYGNPWVWPISFEVIQKNIDQVLQEKAA